MSRTEHILVTDDDPGVCGLLRAGLESAGYAVSEATSRSEVMDSLDRSPVDLITLDLELGRDDALRSVREIRAKRNVPIVIISGRGGPLDRIAGLEQGADDYIAKPFHIQEVVLRVRSVLRRYESAQFEPLDRRKAKAIEVPRLKFTGGVLDSAHQTLRDEGGEVIELTGVEFRLLEVFLGHPARILSRGALMRALGWPDLPHNEIAIDRQVASLRGKIEPAADEPTFIRSVRGVGYVFAEEVEVI
jgi:DNA-binding response OmpR family regulator